MPIVKILNRDYQIACGDGEEQKLLDLSGKLNKRLNEVARSFKGANDSMIIAVTAIMLEDLVSDLQKQNDSLQKQLSKAPVNGVSEDDLNKIENRINKIHSYLSSI